MKSKFIALLFVSAFLAAFIPRSTARAIHIPYSQPDFISVIFCGSRVYFATADYPAHYVFSVDVYSEDETVVDSKKVFSRNAEWITEAFLVGSVDVYWGHQGGAIPDGYFTVTTSTCPSNGLIDMYVYFSDKPFFGQTHTMTIFSAKGFPSKSVLTQLAGGRLPDGFGYGAPACWGKLYDDGTEKGYFVCDSYLSSVGERRAWLRNDPQGSDFDLLPKILAYLEMLKDIAP